jgi:hypothetical protein
MRQLSGHEYFEREKTSFWNFLLLHKQECRCDGSEAYFDDMISKGAMFAWFLYLYPGRVVAATDLIADLTTCIYVSPDPPIPEYETYF